MKASKAVIRQVEVNDSINEEVHKLKLVFAFMSQILDASNEEGINFIGRWNTKYFDSALLTLGETIENIEEILSEPISA